MKQSTRANSDTYPARSYAIYVLCILFLITIISFVDRQLPALLVKPIKSHFGISDTQFSLIQGPSFAIFYTVMGLPFGRLVDRANRRNLVVFGLVLWSSLTVASGLATSYAQLLLFRAGIGIGEACLAPAAYSLIADYFPTSVRARAIGVYYLSFAVGGAGSLVIGGMILGMLPPAGLSVAVLGLMPPWRLVFLFVGMPGLLAAILLLTVREPARRGVAGQLEVEEPSSISAFAGHLRTHWRTFTALVLCIAAVSVAGYANLAWAPTFFERQFGIPAASAGKTIGLILVIACLAGTPLSGLLSDRWTTRGVAASRFKVIGYAYFLFLPASILWPLAASPAACYALLGCSLFAGSICQVAAPVAIQELVPNRMRGQATTSYLLVTGLLALGLAPTVPALLTDYLFHDPNKLGLALSMVALPLGCIGAIAARTGKSPFARSYAVMNVGTVGNGVVDRGSS